MMVLRRMVDRLAADDYGVIYITEQIASEIEETIDRYVKSINSYNCSDS